MDNINPISESPSVRSLGREVPHESPDKKVTDAATGKILYCNGMTTSEELALSHAKTIAALTGLEVELHYNNTTSAKKALAITAKVGLGSLGMGYALVAESKNSLRRWVSRGIGLVGLATFISGMRDLNEIDKQKNASAQRLASRVIAYLDGHPLHHITLIFHSQGADIGHRALEKLAAYKDRINVVTIGGMVAIPDRLAQRVVNFRNDKDLIAYLANTFFDTSGEKTTVQIVDKQSDYRCHYSEDYVRRPEVLNVIRDLAKARSYPLENEREEIQRI
ncbi:MAG TPA: hypothetical protein VMR37_04525 [Rhabdochlamydiaceae bacterium]|jgi:hypothetical protein|nr:hypothetical protein [Rhabdochlamydiaceae bacterium]